MPGCVPGWFPAVAEPLPQAVQGEARVAKEKWNPSRHQRRLGTGPSLLSLAVCRVIDGMAGQVVGSYLVQIRRLSSQQEREYFTERVRYRLKEELRAGSAGDTGRSE